MKKISFILFFVFTLNSSFAQNTFNIINDTAMEATVFVSADGTTSPYNNCVEVSTTVVVPAGMIYTTTSWDTALNWYGPSGWQTGAAIQATHGNARWIRARWRFLSSNPYVNGAIVTGRCFTPLLTDTVDGVTGTWTATSTSVTLHLY